MKIELLVSVLFCVNEVYSYQSSFIRNCLDAHNAVRAHHGVPPLSWSAEIAVNAQKWANHLAAIDQLQHDSTTSDGENLFYMYGGDPEQACDRAVKNWYQEAKNYDFRSPHLDDSTNHFSQLVWRNSKEIGIGTAQSKSGNFFLVARYNPPGNIDGQFNDNVPDVAEQASDESNQESKDNNSANTTPAQDESSSSQPSNDQNVIYFKEINVDPSTAELQNTAEPNPSSPQQADVPTGPSGGPAAESGRGPDASFSSPSPETHESVAVQPSYAVINAMKQQGPSLAQDETSSSQEAVNNGSNYQEGESSSQPDEDKTNSAPLYEGSDHIQSRPFYPESELNVVKARPSETKTRPEEGQNIAAKEEKDNSLEHFVQLPTNDEPADIHEPVAGPAEGKMKPEAVQSSGAKEEKEPVHDKGPTKLHVPPAGLTYIPPAKLKPSAKKPAPPKLKLPPALDLITPKRGKDFRVGIRFKEMNFSSEMQVPGSLAFEEAKRNITSAIINLFDEDNEFQEVQLISLRNGSVIATLGLLFAKDAPGNLDPLTKALMAGKIGNMPVAPKYESAVALPAGYLKPNRPVQERGAGVCPQPCSRPNTCYSSGCTPTCCAFHPPDHKYRPLAQDSPSVLPSCPGTCDGNCFPDCDDDCCSNMMQELEAAPAPAEAPAVAPPSVTCPGSCHFSCYPQCSPQCCSTQYVPNPCHASCPAYCAPSCDNACCAARKSLVNSLSKQYSRYRSAQRALARQLYLKKRLRLQPFRRLKPIRRARPVRPRQRSYYARRARVRPESLGLEEYDHSITEWAKKGEVTKHTNKAKYGSGE